MIQSTMNQTSMIVMKLTIYYSNDRHFGPDGDTNLGTAHGTADPDSRHATCINCTDDGSNVAESHKRTDSRRLCYRWPVRAMTFPRISNGFSSRVENSTSSEAKSLKMAKNLHFRGSLSSKPLPPAKESSPSRILNPHFQKFLSCLHPLPGRS